MRIVDRLRRLMRWLSGDKHAEQFTTNEVNKALLDDSPQAVRVTIWAILAFILAMLIWSSLASIDEVTRGEGRTVRLIAAAKDPEPGRRDCLSGVCA
jgi:adhesin transport system membrane fusion protein